MLKDIILAAAGLVAIFVITRPSHSPAYGDVSDSRDLWRRSCACGNSTAQARELGCKFDALSAAWLPPHCRDDDLLDEFLNHKDGPWEYWADQEHQQPLSMEEVGELGVYTSFCFNAQSCQHTGSYKAYHLFKLMTKAPSITQPVGNITHIVCFTGERSTTVRRGVVSGLGTM